MENYSVPVRDLSHLEIGLRQMVSYRETATKLQEITSIAEKKMNEKKMNEWNENNDEKKKKKNKERKKERILGHMNLSEVEFSGSNRY